VIHSSPIYARHLRAERPSPIRRWEMSVRAVLEFVKHGFLAEEPLTNASVDTLGAHRRHDIACGGNSNR
jgi:hypothetical protein